MFRPFSASPPTRTLKEQENITLKNTVAKLQQQLHELSAAVRRYQQEEELPPLPRDDDDDNTGNDVTNTIASKLTDMACKEDVKAIPFYNGFASDQNITAWVKETESVAIVNNWKDQQRKRYIVSRLKGQALNWHMDRMRTRPVETFEAWKATIINQFKDPASREMEKKHFFNLKQKKINTYDTS